MIRLIDIISFCAYCINAGRESRRVQIYIIPIIIIRDFRTFQTITRCRNWNGKIETVSRNWHSPRPRLVKIVVSNLREVSSRTLLPLSKDCHSRQMKRKSSGAKCRILICLMLLISRKQQRSLSGNKLVC